MKTAQLLASLLVLLVSYPAVSQTTSPGSTPPPVGPSPVTSDKPTASSDLPSNGGALRPANGNDAKQQGELSSASFVTDAAQAGMFEVAAGKLALSRTSNRDLKEFAQRVVTDHGSANDKLTMIATRNQLEAPKTLDAEHSEKLSVLKAKSGAEFDQACISEMQNGHEQAIALFTAATTSKTVIIPLRDFASITLPVIRQHHQMIMKLH